ncbi:MAG: hypothetical protein HC933_21645 [Pleurocapsa sp. SU_196_0]|nr:hypothetical protein [Pleurocapsa sp. SU_196_0]
MFLEIIGSFLALFSLVFFWYGVFRKRGQKAKWIYTSLALGVVASILLPKPPSVPRAGNQEPTPITRAAPPRAQPKRTIDDAVFMTICQELVQKRLRSPGSAKFQGAFQGLELPREVSGGKKWRSWVDAQNTFGALLRVDFSCSYFSATDEVKLVSFKQR